MRDRPSASDRHRAPGLRAGQITHHRNEDKRDGRPSNLEAQDRGAHTSAHNKSRSLSKLRAVLRRVSGADKTKDY